MKIYYHRYLKQFVRQKPIGKYIVDFFCNKLQLAIELDGYSHQFADVYKEEQLRNTGITLLRLQDDEVMNDVDNVLRAIEIFIKEFEDKNKHTP